MKCVYIRWQKLQDLKNLKDKTSKEEKLKIGSKTGKKFIFLGLNSVFEDVVIIDNTIVRLVVILCVFIFFS